MNIMDYTNFYENMTNYTSSSDNDQASLASLVPTWTRVSLVVFILVAMVIGIPGNSLVMTMLLKLPRKTSTDCFIIFISLVDVLSLLVSGPTHIMIVTPAIWTSLSSDILCKFHMYFSHFVNVQSALLIMCVGLDRYVKTCKPHSVLFTTRSAFITCLVATVVSAIFNVSHFFTTKLNQNGNCVLDSERATIRLSMYGIGLAFYVIVSATLCVLYSRIARVIRKRVKVQPESTILLNIKSTSRNKSFLEKTKPQNPNALNSRSNGIASRYEGSVKNTETTVLGQTSKQTDQPNQAESTKVLQTTSTQMFSTSKKQNHPRADERVQKIHVAPISRSLKYANKTNKIMGAITVVYVISATFPVIAVAVLTLFAAIKNHVVGRIVTFLILRLYMVNNFANPIFYGWLSSTFRQNVRKNLECYKS